MIKIGISGAAGRLGREVADAVAASAETVDVVLTSRHAADLDATRRAIGEVRFADFDQPESLLSAFAGVERLLIISTDAVGKRVTQHEAAFVAARRVGVRHVIYTSMISPVEGHPSGLLVHEHRESEFALIESGLDWTILRFGFFAEGLLAAARRAIQTGRFVSNAGGGPASWVALADCAAVAARILVAGGHTGRRYDVVGPQLVRDKDVVELLSDRCGRPIDLVEVDDMTYRANLVGRGLPIDVAEEYTSYGAAIRLGFAANASTVVHDLTGRLPRSLSDVFAAVSDWPIAVGGGLP
jgi:NAD(P)H dehydrogenase (quinone)